MAKQATAQNATLKVPAFMPLHTPLNGSLASALAHTGEVVSDACAKWQHEVMDFVGARLKADQDLQAALTGCETTTDLARVQRDWATAAAEAYMEQSSRLMSIGMAAARESISTWLDTAHQGEPAQKHS